MISKMIFLFNFKILQKIMSKYTTKAGDAIVPKVIISSPAIVTPFYYELVMNKKSFITKS